MWTETKENWRHTREDVPAEWWALTCPLPRSGHTAWKPMSRGTSCLGSLELMVLQPPCCALSVCPPVFPDGLRALCAVGRASGLGMFLTPGGACDTAALTPRSEGSRLSLPRVKSVREGCLVCRCSC